MDNFLIRPIAVAITCSILNACSSSTEGVGSANTGVDAGAKGHALKFTGNLVEQNGELTFMTPSVSIIKVPAAQIVGKPYMVASYAAGFAPGNDPAIHHTWGSVPADLKIRYTTPATYQNGAYDMVLVVYANTPITDDIRSGPAQNAPAAKGGDMATFTLDMRDVRPGDPSLPPGVVRLNVEGGDAEVTVENKVATDPNQISAALFNTVMLIP
jgi:hypothetical protein